MLEFHPYANLFHLLEGDEFAALVQSIRENGLREPIALSRDGRILDGRNRYRACLEAQVEPRFVTPLAERDSEVQYVLDQNLTRRHLNASQKAMLAAEMLPLLEEEARKRQVAGLKQSPSVSANLRQRETGKSSKIAGNRVGVAPRNVEAAKVVTTRGVPELAETVRKGDVPVSVAEKVARMPEPKQADFLNRFFAAPETPPHQIVAKMHREETRQKIVEAAQTESPELPTGKRYAVIYADPPWRYEQQPMGHTDRGVENHYPTLSAQEICALPVREVALNDAILFLWATAPCLPEALRVMDAWGFVYKTHMVWVKDRAGTGYHVRNQHELLLIGRRGEIPLPEPSNRPPSVLSAPLGRHSEKPAAFYEIIEAMYPGLPAIELFSRCPRTGWASWGLEAK